MRRWLLPSSLVALISSSFGCDALCVDDPRPGRVEADSHSCGDFKVEPTAREWTQIESCMQGAIDEGVRAHTVVEIWDPIIAGNATTTTTTWQVLPPGEEPRLSRTTRFVYTTDDPDEEVDPDYSFALCDSFGNHLRCRGAVAICSAD
ncbi:hypothetical protein ACNOYE_00465 [Nannocystaceae bacterium ST9]